MEPHSVQPELMSVIVRVRANSPSSVGPQCATVSHSSIPGTSSSSSLALRMVIELQSSSPGRVALLPFNSNAARAGARYRSTVAALIRRTSSVASAVANGWSRSPASRSSGSHPGSITTKYFPHGNPISFHR